MAKMVRTSTYSEIFGETTLRYWVIKGNPYVNDWDSMLVPSTSGTWHTGRAPKEWFIGDRLFCWESTPALRMIGLAHLLQTDCGLDEEGDQLFQVEYLTTRFESMPGIAELRTVPILNTASFLKTGPATTVFPLSPEQADVLVRLLVARNPRLASVWDDLGLMSTYMIAPNVDDAGASLEGSKKWLAHFVRERNRSVVENKKANVLRKTGALACEICAFDFAQRFGSLGESFCEVHHRLPLAEADAPVATRLEDLAIVCSNCHRMLHRTSPALSVEGLKALLTERSNNALHPTCEDARA